MKRYDAQNAQKDKEYTMARSEMIFMCQRGSKLNHSGPIGLVTDGHTLPVAFKDTGDCEDLGFRACWESQACIDDFFATLRIETQNAPGLYYVCAVFDHEDDDEDDWEHLADMSCEHMAGAGFDGTMKQIINDAGYGDCATNKWRWA